jgi:aarF domain-containing kinase
LSKIPTSLFGRGSKLLGLASKMAVEEVSSRLKTWEDEKDKLKSKVQLAQDIVKTLSQLKGASMKLGQLMSLDLGNYLPPEIVKILEQLHHQSTFLDYSKIEKILKDELKENLSHFTDISMKPIAAASIGQVHRAKLDGKDIVIKVQYPGVAESIPSDLKILEVILKQASLFQRKDLDLGPFFAEVKDVLVKEADYLNEVKMHDLYRERFKDSPFIIPEVYAQYSTTKIITQEFIEGQSFTAWLDSNPSEEKRMEFADLLMKLYLEEIFCHHLVQTDPNPGNFLVTPDEKIALLDFGAVKVYSTEFVEAYRKVLIAAFHRDQEKIIQESIKLGFLDERESDEVKKLYLVMMEFLAEPFRQEEEFDFADQDFFNESKIHTWELTKKCRYSPPPKDLLFLHRKLGGIFIFIKRLGVKLRLKNYWHYVDRDFKESRT